MSERWIFKSSDFKLTADVDPIPMADYISKSVSILSQSLVEHEEKLVLENSPISVLVRIKKQVDAELKLRGVIENEPSA